jgi:outer membrane protein assembly factor BamD
MRSLWSGLLLLMLVLFSGCAKEVKLSTLTAKQLLLDGEKAMHAQQFQKAAKYFDEIRTRFPFGRVGQQALLDQMYTAVQDYDPVGALTAAQTYIQLYPRDRHVDYAYYIRGMANFSRGMSWVERIFKIDVSARDSDYLKQSFRDFNILLQRFPHSSYAPNARLRMIFVRNVLAQHTLKVAEFYYRQAAYVAAANRGQELVLHYQGAPQVVPALQLLVKSYRALGMQEQANQSARVLKILQDKINKKTS